MNTCRKRPYFGLPVGGLLIQATLHVRNNEKGMIYFRIIHHFFRQVVASQYEVVGGTRVHGGNHLNWSLWHFQQSVGRLRPFGYQDRSLLTMVQVWTPEKKYFRYFSRNDRKKSAVFGKKIVLFFSFSRNTAGVLFYRSHLHHHND